MGIRIMKIDSYDSHYGGTVYTKPCVKVYKRDCDDEHFRLSWNYDRNNCAQTWTS